MNALVSVVIPTLKGREDVLKRAVASVEKQTYKNIEILVITEGNSGGEARNIGVKRAKGSYVAFLDDDDTWKPTKIEKQMKIMQKYSDCPIVTCYSKDHRFDRVRIDRPPSVADQNMILNAFNYSSTSTYLCRKYPFEQLGGFDEDLPSAQEYELAIRFSEYHNVRCVDEVLVEQFSTEGQISEDWGKKRKGLKMVYKKHKKAFKRASGMNSIKLIGILSLYLSATILGSRIYSIINIVRKQYNEDDDRKKILFVYKQKNKGFIRTDYEMLSKHYNVTKFHFSGIKSVPKLFMEMRKHDIIFVWFISLHTFFTSFSRKKKIYVAGGYDVANEPRINYGLARGGFTKWMVRYCLNHADKILTVSEANDNDLHDNFGPQYNTDMIYNCPDDELFVPGKEKDPTLIITVGLINKETWIRKGIAKFVDLAHFFDQLDRDYKFVVIGKIDDSMQEIVKESQKTASNLKFTGFISNEELLDYYQRAKVYCQLSYYESYGLAVSEAMLCECVPVVANRKALPEVIGDHGFKVSLLDMGCIEEAITRAVRKDGKAGREYTLENFNKDKREKALVRVVEEVC